MNFTTYKVRLIIFIFFSFFFGKNSFALDSLSYSGRLVQTNGSPVTGTVTLKAELAYTNALGTILCTKTIPGVALSKGVFHVKLDFDCSASGLSLTQVLSQVPNGESVAIQISDISNPANPKSYNFQALHSIPFANVASQLVQMAATPGKVLAWDGTKWAPTAASGGTVTIVSGTLPISVANGASAPVVSIAQASSSTGGYLSNTDWNTFNSKQGALPAGGNTTHYYRGDNSWQTLNTDAVPEGARLYFENARVLLAPLTGFLPSSSAIVDTDTILQAFNKTQGQINLINTNSSAYVTKTGTSTLAAGTIDAQAGFVLVGVPGSINDATPRGYVDTQDSLKVNRAGDTITGVLTLNNDLQLKGGSNYVTLKGHASSVAYDLFLPSSAGTPGYVLSTDGSGNTSWINPSSVSAGSGTVNSASITDGSIVDADINASAAIAQSKIAGLTTDLSNKEPTITAGTTAQYWKGNKTWSSLQTDVQALVVNNYTVGSNASLANTDTLSGAFGKVQGQINATNTAVAGKEPSLAAGTASQYYSGNKTWQTLNGGAVANTAAGNIAATNVQLALNELDTEKQANITSSSAITSGSVTTSLQNGVNVNPFGAAVGNTGELRFYELTAGGTNYTSLKAPDALAADINYVLPSVAPTAGQVLSSNASGVMSWLTIPSAPVSTVFGRTGAVVATAGDYTATQITNTPAGSIAATNVQAALNELDTDKQSLITAGTTAQYYRGDKTFVDLGTDVRATALTGYVVGTNTALSATDTTLGAFQKVQGQINATNTAVAGKEPAITAGTTAQYIRGDKTLSTFATDAINSVLSTFALNAGAKPAVANTDSVVGAFGKVQKFINDINSDYVSKSANQTINGTLAINSVTGFITVPTPVNPNDAANKAYVDGFGQWLESGANIYFNTGNVGIGTTTPSNSLSVHSAEKQIRIQDTDDATGVWAIGTVGADNRNLNFIDDNTNIRMTIQEAGNVGIGTTNPAQKLDVLGTIRAGNQSATSGSVMLVDNYGTGNLTTFGTEYSSGGPVIGYGVTAGTTLANFVSSTPNSTQNRTAINTGSDIRFYTGPSQTVSVGSPVTMSEVMRISNAGNVGIGTTAPTAPLTIGDSISHRGFLLLKDDGTNQPVIQLASSLAGGRAYNIYSGLSAAGNFDISDSTAGNLPRFTINSSGNVGIGTTAPSEKLEVVGNVKATEFLYSSDERLKHDIKTLSKALDKIFKLRGVEFKWNKNDEHTMGFIAQEVEKVLPELVKTDKYTSLKSVQYGNLVALLVEAMKEESQNRLKAERKLSSTVENMQKDMKKLEQENLDLKNRLEKIEKYLNEKR